MTEKPSKLRSFDRQ